MPNEIFIKGLRCPGNEMPTENREDDALLQPLGYLRKLSLLSLRAPYTKDCNIDGLF